MTDATSHARRFAGSRPEHGRGCRFDQASLQCESETPGETLSRSTDSGWTSVLVNLSRYEAASHAFETARTTDQRISVLMKGELDLEVLRNGAWRRAALLPGSAFVIPGGQTQRMRWSSRRSAARPEMMHLSLPRQLVSWAVERCRSPDGRGDAEALESQSFLDPVVATVGRSLLEAMGREAPDSYAETTARWFAMHLTSMRGGWTVPHEPRYPDLTTDRNLARAIEYMSAHLSQPLTLDILAREAGISKFHFSRRFKSGTGTTPFSHLLDLRRAAARRMLANTDDPVGQIANACGYQRGSHFGTAFSKRFGETPTAFRRRSRPAVTLG